MSGSFPATPELQDIQISSTHPTFISTAHSGKRQARSRAAQMWSISGSYAALSREVFAPLFAFMLKQKGQYESFTYIPPVYGDARGDVSSCTASAASAGDTEVTVTMTGTLKEGDYVKFASHDKVYMVIDDLTGNGDLSIFPDLIADVAGQQQFSMMM